jgi:nitrate reductase NapD
LKPDARKEWHLASLLVRHHPEALPALASAIARAEGLELELQDDTRSVLVQESDGTAGLMANIDLLHAVPGVVSVNLVYHHVERQPPLDDLPAFDTQESAG